MSYRLKIDESACAGLERIVSEQIDKALRDVGGASEDVDEAVHELRKRCRKLRGLLRLYRDALGSAYTRENARLREFSRSFSETRDSAARLESLAELFGHYPDQWQTFAPVEAELRRRHEARGDPALPQKLAEAERTMEALRKSSQSWDFGDDFRSVGRGFCKAYARGRAARSALRSGDADELHELRKCAKYHGYHLRLLEASWPSSLKASRKSSEKLAEILGKDRDLVLLRELVFGEPDAFGGPDLVASFMHATARRRKELKDEARPLAARVFAEKPKAISRRMKTYWKASRFPHTY